MIDESKKKQLRRVIAVISSYVEIFISALLLIGIIIGTINLAVELISMGKEALVVPEITMPVEQYLATGLQLIIGVEFIKMISKHTVGSTIDVLLFAIARKLIISHGGAIELLLSVIAIAILFIIKKHFGNKCEKCAIALEKNGQ